MARVRGVMAASTAAGSILNVSGSMSTNTGVPPALWIVPAVAKNVKGVVMTSSPGPRSSALRGRSSASVPLAQAMPCVAPARRATAASRRGTAERVLAERDPAQNRGVGADGAPPFDARGSVLVLARHVAPRVQHVGEHARRPAEHIVLQGHAFVDRHVVLDLDVVADPRARHHHHVLAQIAPLADDRAGHDVAKVPDLRAPADARAVVDIA